VYLACNVFNHTVLAKVHATPIYVQSDSVITLSKGPNILCRYKRVSLSVGCMVKVKERYFKIKYRPAGILFNVNGMIYCKFKLQLKFINKKYSPLIANFHAGLRFKTH
jgi:hypothetical protein